jgi:16S rRNA (cytosine967-C5)-methyltransferase
MSEPHPPTARALALRVLLACRPGDAFVQDVLDRHLKQAPLSPADRRLATQLVYGVLRRRGTLDALLQPFCNRPRDRVEFAVREILRLGAYQLALLTQIPPHAALYETVNLADPRARPFVNGVLRALSRVLTPARADGPAADALPLAEGEYRRLSQAVLPDPSAHPVHYLASAFALPRWLVTRWLARHGWEECVRLGFWFVGQAALWLRCNTLKCDRPNLLTAFAEAGITAEAGEPAQAIRLPETHRVVDLPGYAEGWFTVQDESAQRVALALAPEPGSAVLDLCAAPGGKTTHLAELMRNRGRVVACDIRRERLDTLTELCQRLGVGIVEPFLIGADGEPPPGPFDAALVDVPCSNTGVLGKRPEVRWRLRAEDVNELAALQTRLLTRAAKRVRPGGVVVYSTCSIEPEENFGVVDAVLRERPDFVLEADEERRPGLPADGAYWARLRRGL